MVVTIAAIEGSRRHFLKRCQPSAGSSAFNGETARPE